VDLALNYEEPVARLRPRVREVGDLSAVVALDTVEAEGLFLHPAAAMLTEQGGGRWLRVNAPVALTLRRGTDASSEAVRTLGPPPGPASAPAAPPELSARPTGGAADTLRIDGSPGVRPLVAALVEAYRSRTPGAPVALNDGLGTQARARAVAGGTIDVAMASHGIDSVALAGQGIAVHEIAKVAVVFAVHAGVPVTSLRAAQLCDVYRGRTTSWRELGGAALPIAPRVRPESEVDTEVVRAGVACFPADSAMATVTVVDRPEQMAAAIAAQPGAIGMTSMPFVEQSGGRIRAVALDGTAPTAANVRRGSYRLTRASYLLTRADAPPPVRRFLAFVRGAEGRRIIEANGGVPVP
jgi:phosphate transport system substrate-binding protein